MRETRTKRMFLSPIRRLFSVRKVLLICTVAAAFLVAAPLLTYSRLSYAISDRDQLMNRDQTGIILRDRNGEVLYKYGKINSEEELKLNQISDHVEQAVLASEDREFYQHDGYSVRGMIRSLYANALSQDPYRHGGSTITQQLAKNKLLGSSDNYFDKYQEVTMAVAIERQYSKEEIMEMYLNSVYFGEGAFGVAAAADTYFGKSAQDLDLAESSMLVGLLTAPSVYSPISGDQKKAKEKQNWVLSRMAESGYIDWSERSKAKDKKIAYAYKPNEKIYGHAQHFVMMVLDELKKKYGEENTGRLGFDVTTTLDLDWQKSTQKRVQEKINEIKHLGASNASTVAIDPKSGEVRVLVGSVNWNNPKFGKVNMATTPRQPGSSFKPIYYTEALGKKIITPATILKDKEEDFGDYTPQNYDFEFRGDIPVRHALSQSLNIPSVRVMKKLGVNDAAETAQRMGLATVNQPDRYGLALALGTAEVRVLDMTNAYAAFANQGNQYPVTMVKSIKNKFGHTVFEAVEAEEKRVASPEASFLISSILSDNKARSPTFGNSLNVDGRQVAVKTGTTDESKDAWTMGYTPNISVGVWVGNNQHRPMTNLIGSTSAGAIWRGTMEQISAEHPKAKFKPPSSVIKTEVCTSISLASFNSGNQYEEYFIKGTQPKESCVEDEPPVITTDQQKPPREEETETDRQPDREREANQGPGSDDNDERDGSVGGGTEAPSDPEPEPEEEEPEEEEEEESSGTNSTGADSTNSSTRTQQSS